MFPSKQISPIKEAFLIGIRANKLNPVLILPLLFLTACSGTRSPVTANDEDTLSIAMALYDPTNISEKPANLPVSVQHQKVARFYSKRLNQLFKQWIQLDNTLIRRMAWYQDGMPVDSAHNFRGYFTQPVLGSGEFLKTISFSRSAGNGDPTITVRISKGGPQNLSSSESKITLHFIKEDGHYVIDNAQEKIVFRHPYHKPSNYTVRRSLDQQIALRSKSWKDDLDKLNSRRE